YYLLSELISFDALDGYEELKESCFMGYRNMRIFMRKLFGGWMWREKMGRLKLLFQGGIGGELKGLLGRREWEGFVLRKVKQAMYLSFTNDTINIIEIRI